MTNALRKMIQHQAYQIVLLQLGGIAFLSLLACLFKGTASGFSVLCGGLAYGLPNLFFVWRVFRFTGAQEMHRFIAAFFAGEALKLILSAILFLVIVKYLPVSLLSTLIGFVGAIVSFWIACMWYFSGQSKRGSKF